MAKTYKLDPAASSTFGTVNLTSATSFTYEQQGEETVLGTDGKPFIQDTFFDNLSYTVSLVTTDTSHDFSIGDKQTLILRAQERDGVDVAGALTFTFSNAMVSGSNGSVNHAGNAEQTITFRVSSSDGTTDPLVIT